MGGSDPLRADPHVHQAGAPQHARLPGAVLNRPGEALWPGLRTHAALDAYCLGQISLDRVWVAPRARHEAAEAPPPELPERTGGQIASAALGLARLGLRTAYAGAVGADVAAERVLEPLLAAGVDCADVRRRAGGATRAALVRVETENGERAVEPWRDPAVALSAADVALARVRGARALLLDAEDVPASVAAAAAAREARIPVVLDADRPLPGLLEELLPRVDFPLVSRPFAEWLGKGSLKDGVDALARWGARMAVVTLGDEGALARIRGGPVLATPAFCVEARDTTGAGDAFHAGFVWGLLEGCDVDTTLRRSHAVAALACRAVGAQAGLPTRDEALAFLAEAKPR